MQVLVTGTSQFSTKVQRRQAHHDLNVKESVSDICLGSWVSCGSPDSPVQHALYLYSPSNDGSNVSGVAVEPPIRFWLKAFLTVLRCETDERQTDLKYLSESILLRVNSHVKSNCSCQTTRTSKCVLMQR